LYYNYHPAPRILNVVLKEYTSNLKKKRKQAFSPNQGGGRVLKLNWWRSFRSNVIHIYHKHLLQLSICRKEKLYGVSCLIISSVSSKAGWGVDGSLHFSVPFSNTRSFSTISIGRCECSLVVIFVLLFKFKQSFFNSLNKHFSLFQWLQHTKNTFTR
jgi:hypothetical protein